MQRSLMVASLVVGCLALAAVPAAAQDREALIAHNKEVAIADDPSPR
jgi:hypothetical protein